MKIPAVSQQQAVEAIAAALENLAQNPALLLQYGRASRLRVSERIQLVAQGAAKFIRSTIALLARNPIVAPARRRIAKARNEPEVPAYRGDTF